MLRTKRLLALLLLAPVITFAQQTPSVNQQAIQLLQQHAHEIGISYNPQDLLIRDSYITQDGLQMLYVDQAFKGIPINKAMLVLAFKNDKLVSRQSSILPNVEIRNKGKQPIPAIAVQNAALSAIRSRPQLPAVIENPSAIQLEKGYYNLGKMAASQRDVYARLCWIVSPTDSLLSLQWEIAHSPLQEQKSWLTYVNAQTGKVTTNISQTLECFNDNEGQYTESITNGEAATDEQPEFYALNDDAGYRVIPFPAENRFLHYGTVSLQTNPWEMFAANNPAISLKWHSDGTTTYTTTRGNNVQAIDGSGGGIQPSITVYSQTPDGLLFDFDEDSTIDPRQTSPVPNRQFGITNLFYWNNLCHDISYQYGFDEVSGNFQRNNLGRGGLGADDVLASSQTAFLANNATFTSFPDGQRCLMRMGLFSDPGYPLVADASVDNGIIVHEYAHGISSRLTGGPGTVGCLSNDEQMGEGWSDYFGIMYTQDWANSNLNTGYTQPRSNGSASANRMAGGPGVRTQLYCTNYGINNRSYAASIGNNSPHLHGEIWCAILWDMTWNIIRQTGVINPNLINAAAPGGNSIALKLVMEGLRLQKCSPGFVDGRDAILKADTILYSGAYSAAIWEAFRRRGVGPLASQGSSDSRTDQVPDFGTGPRIKFVSTSKSTAEQTISNGGPCKSFRLDTIYFTITTPSAQGATVQFYKLGGTALEGLDVDFNTNGNFDAPVQSVFYPANSSIEIPVYLRIYDDNSWESTETFQLGFSVSGPSDILEGSADNQTFTYTINDNDKKAGDIFSQSFTVPIETALNAQAQAQVTAFSTQIVNSPVNKMILGMEIKTPTDYGCTAFRIDRAGTGMVLFTDTARTSALLSKTYSVTPATPNPNGEYEISLLFTQAEINGWEAATGRKFSEIELIRTDSAISKASPANPGAAGAISYDPKPVIQNINGGKKLTGKFSGGFGGFAAGVYTPTINFVDTAISVEETTEASTNCRNFKKVSIPFEVTRPLAAATRLHLFVEEGGTLIPETDFLWSAVNDFTPTNDTLSLPAGFVGTGYVYVRIYNDHTWERGKTFSLGLERLDSNNLVKLGLRPSITVTLLDFDFDPNGGDTLSTSFGKVPVPYQGVNWSPFTSLKYSRHQYLFTAQEMASAGMAPNQPIQQIAFQVASKQTVAPFTGMRVSIKLGTETDLAGGPVTTGFTEVFVGDYSTVQGENRIVFSTPFTWDGSSNIIIQICRSYNNASTANDFILVDESPAFGTAKASYSSFNLNVVDPCTNLANPIVSVNRPVITFYQVSKSILVATGANASGTEAVNKFSETYFFNTNNRIFARIKNLKALNYGCTNVAVDRNGTSGVPFLAATADGDLFSKTVFIDPGNDFADGDYEISLYFSDAEVSGWQTHTGKLATNAKMVHTDSAISKVTPANPRGGGQIRVDINSNSLPGDARITVTARFQGKLRGGFGVGIPYTSIYTFTGYGPWTNTANWQANLAPPPVVPKASAIVINPSGQCVLNTSVQLQPGAGLFVQPGKEFIVNGVLQVQ